MDNLSSKPKVNRMPPLPISERGVDGWSSDSCVIWKSMWSFAIVGVLMLTFIGYQYSIGTSDVAVVSPDDELLISLVSSSGDTRKFGDSSLYFKDEGGVIVGQTVKITSGSEKIIPDKAQVTMDKVTKSELLAILSKY